MVRWMGRAYWCSTWLRVYSPICRSRRSSSGNKYRDHPVTFIQSSIERIPERNIQNPVQNPVQNTRTEQWDQRNPVTPVQPVSPVTPVLPEIFTGTSNGYPEQSPDQPPDQSTDTVFYLCFSCIVWIFSSSIPYPLSCGPTPPQYYWYQSLCNYVVFNRES